MSKWARRLESGWYQGSPWLTPLRPLGALAGAVAACRYRRFQCDPVTPPVPVLVVGNITVGGTGKTPLVIALAHRARERGLRVAVISRGYGGRTRDYPHRVDLDDDAADVGDEPLLIRYRAGVPVVLDPQRARALEQAVSDFRPDLVISDDGLQHHALPRSAEVVVIDAERGLGNGRCLPAGPLREPASRLEQVDFIVANGGDWPGAVTMRLVAGSAVSLQKGSSLEPNLLGKRYGTLHGVAGIGNPERFFRTLAGLGLDVIPHVFPDHHSFRAADLAFGDGRAVIMTEKDAVKCRSFEDSRLWMLPVSASLPEGSLDAMIDRALTNWSSVPLED